MAGRHVALVVEDEPEMAEELLDLLDTLDYDAVHASSQKEGLELAKKGGFCFVLMDLQIKVDPKKRLPPSAEFGRKLIEQVRELYPHRNQKRKSCLPIVVLSGQAQEHEDVMAAVEAGADDFVKKPLSRSKRSIRDVIETWLANSGREDHERCAAVTAEARDGVPTVKLAVTGRPDGRRLEIVVDERSVPVTVASFLTLLKLVGARLLTEEGTVHRTALGAKDEQALQAASRLRQDLRPHVPRPVDPVVCVGAKNYCLNSAIQVDPVDWPKLERHPDPDVSRLAKEIVATHRDP